MTHVKKCGLLGGGDEFNPSEHGNKHLFVKKFQTPPPPLTNQMVVPYLPKRCMSKDMKQIVTKTILSYV